MRKVSVIFLFVLLCLFAKAQETIAISGRATDFDGNPIDSCVIKLKYSNFSDAYETYTDKDGYYSLPEVKKGKYVSLYAIRPKEYPRPDRVPDDQKRLEFWAWDVIADRDLIINPRYDKLELYGVNAFEVQGGLPGIMIYVRPMSLGKLLSYDAQVRQTKADIDKTVDINIPLEHFVPRVFLDEEETAVRLIQPVEEYSSIGANSRGFLLFVDRPKVRPNKPYIIIRIEATYTELNEKGENIYFYELPDYVRSPQ